MPNANPVHFSGSYPTFANTAGSTMPAPAISIQPECLHTGHPLPPHMMQLKSYSTLGSVKGKKCGRSRIFTFGPYISVAKV